VKIRLLIYKLLTIVWFSLLIAAMVFPSQGAFNRSLAAFFDSSLCCRYSGSPYPLSLLSCASWSVASCNWPLLLDLPFYIADVLLLRECPRCERQLVAMPAKSMGSVT
jgi:hypothetical protein